MPLFEFQCADCEQEFEEVCRSWKTVVKCPKCNSENTVKLVSLPSKPRFIGQGFYETDYKNKPKT
jgi:putative FmdB family regulatory protein